MSDVFGRNLQYTGTIKPESIFFSDTGGLASGLVSGVQLEYAQQVSRMWSLLGGGTGGGAQLWLIAGETNGNLKIDSLFGSGTSAAGDICNPGSCSLTAEASACRGPAGAGGAAKFTMENSFLTAVGIAGSTGGALSITRSIGVGFLTLSQ